MFNTTNPHPDHVALGAIELQRSAARRSATRRPPTKSPAPATPAFHEAKAAVAIAHHAKTGKPRKRKST